MLGKLKIIKPLIIGLGVAGKRHLEAQLQLGYTTGVFSSNIGKGDPLRKQNDVIIFDNLQKAICWSNLVHVCTPDDKHTEFVSRAIKNGKAVLCEKSFTTSLKDALYLQKLVHENNTLLLIAQNYRLTPTFLETKKMVLGGAIGKVTGIKTTYLHDRKQYQQRAPLRKNEDFLYIGGSHAVDLASWIANEAIVSIQVKANHYPLGYQINLKFTSGLLGYITLDASSPQPRNGTDLIVEGSKGKLVSHNKSDQLLYYKNGDKNHQSIVLPNNQTLTTALEVKIIDHYLLGLSDSYWPLPEVDESLNTIKVLDAIQNAVFLGTDGFLVI